MGPLKVAHLNGLSVSRPPLHSDLKDEPERASNDERVRLHFLTRHSRLIDGRRPLSASRLRGLVCASRRSQRGGKKRGGLSVPSVCGESGPSQSVYRR